MNAHAPIAPALTPLAVTNIEVLAALDCADDAFANVTDLARDLGRDESNLRKTLKALAAAGLVREVTDRNVPGLTQAGLDALAAWARANAPGDAGLYNHDGQRIEYIRFEQIDAWHLNPRTQFDPASIEDMAQSIADKGVLQPLTVRRKNVPSGAIWYEVVIGERRRRGARLAVERGWVDKNFAVPCQVRDWTDDEALDVAGVENLQRQDLHWMDEAKFYLRLAERGRSGAEIARLAGESVSKRKVQDYCMIARKLSAEDIARCYLPDGHKDQLLYTKARDLAGERQQKPALELSPRLALAFGELLTKATGGHPDPKFDHQAIATLHQPPVGGPLQQLQDRKLVTFGFGQDKRLEARLAVTDEVRQWARHVGLIAPEGVDPATHDPREGHRKLLTAIVGEMIASTWPPGRFHTPELNAPEPDLHLPREAAGGGPSAEEPMVEGASQAPGYREPDHDLAREAFDGEPEEELPGYLMRLAGGAPPPSPAPTPDPEDLPPMLAIVMIEAAHKIGVEGIERGPETWGAPILGDFYKDARGQQLVMKRFLAFMPYGERQLVTIARRGRDWLEQAERIASPGGRPHLALGDLMDAQRTYAGAIPDGRLYNTPWLNKPTEDLRPGAEAGGDGAATPSRERDEADREPASSSPSVDHLPREAEGGGPSAEEPMVEGAGQAHGDAIAEGPTPEQRALRAAYGLLEDLDRLIVRLRDKASESQRYEVDKYRTLIANVRAQAEPHMPEGM